MARRQKKKGWMRWRLRQSCRQVGIMENAERADDPFQREGALWKHMAAIGEALLALFGLFSVAHHQSCFSKDLGFSSAREITSLAWLFF